MKKVGGFAVIGAVVAAVIVVLSSGGSPDRPDISSRPMTYAELRTFPLWREVRGPFAKIGEGEVPNGTRWAAYVWRGAPGKSGRENPNLTVSRITVFGANDEAVAGGPLAPIREGWSPVTAMFTALNSAPGEGKPETFLAMSFKPSITSILIGLANGEAIRERTHLLNRFQQRKAHLPALRYLALGMERELCIAKVMGYNADGEVAFEGRYTKCHTIPFSYNFIRERLRRIHRRSTQR